MRGLDRLSTDAYAGTFLTAVWATWQVKPSVYLGRLAKLKTGISKAVDAIEATMDTDGLTWAKPSWHVKYAMDQAEVYEGLDAARVMGQALGDSALATRAASDAQQLKLGFDALWNTTTQAYDWALAGDGVRQTTDWSVLYPDATEEAWAVSFGLADSSNGPDLMNHFAAAQPNWDQPAATANFYNGSTYVDTVGYWPVVGWAFYLVGDGQRAQQAALQIRSAAVAANRAWPFTTATAGQLIELETGGVQVPWPVFVSSVASFGVSSTTISWVLFPFTTR